MLASSTILYLNQNSSVIQALSTIILVLITFYYAWQTRRSVKEMEKSRQDSRMPVIKISIGGLSLPAEKNGKRIQIEIFNIGSGIAQSLTIKFPFAKILEVGSLSNKEESNSETIILSENDAVKINDLTKDKKIIIAEYRDIFGRKIKTMSHFSGSIDASSAICGLYIKSWSIILPK